MKRIKEYYVTIILIAAVIIINIAAFALYISNINRDIQKQTEEHLVDIMEEASTSVELKVEETIHELEMTAYYISMSDNYLEETTYANIVKMTRKAGFEKFDIIGADGTGLEENGSKDYSEKKFFSKVMNGSVSILDISDSEGNTKGVRFSVPIRNEVDEIEGVYLVECDLDSFTELLNLDSVNSKGKAFIIKSDGTVLSRKTDSSIRNVSDILDNETNVKTLKNYMKSKKAGVVGFANGKDSKRYICYSKTNFNSWEIIMVVSSSGVEANISDVTDNFVFLGVIIGVMLIVLIAYFIYTLVSVKSKSAINLQRYYMVSKYTEDIIFDYSCVKDTLYSNENWKKLFGYELPKESVKEKMEEYVAEQDRAFYREKIEEAKKSKDGLVQFKCSILDQDKNAVSCICKIFAVKDNMGKVIKIVGVIEKAL
ncbi:MAG: cache domain-containing protein [Lachnospiraceae bacterium]